MIEEENEKENGRTHEINIRRRHFEKRYIVQVKKNYKQKAKYMRNLNENANIEQNKFMLFAQKEAKYVNCESDSTTIRTL